MRVNDIIYEMYNLKGFGRVKVNNILSQTYLLTQKNNFSIEENIINKLRVEYNIDLEHSVNLHNRIDELEHKIGQRIKFINLFDQEYPNTLNLLGNSKPPILSYLGNIELLRNKKIGFCGSRKASEKGFDIAKDVSQQVSEKDITVVSGYASGIDLETHYWALKENGSTIIVLPEGILNFSIKRQLKDVWNWDRVLVISEFELNAIWSVNRAMERNSTIVALSDIMILIEARIKGGSIDAGLKTLQFKKVLFAPVYSGMPEEASGNDFLLNKGAFPIKRNKDTNRANLNQMYDIFDQYNSFKSNLFD